MRSFDKPEKEDATADIPCQQPAPGLDTVILQDFAVRKA
jgi:hypothetical protein